jgi:hypothetical protein
MGLTRAGISVIQPTRSAPIDAAAIFRLGAAALTASAWATGAIGNYITLPPGRTRGLWMLQVYSADISSGNEAYSFWLHGSNDPNFAAGNCENLGMFDLAATAALRASFPAGQDTIWPGVTPGTSSAIYAIPVSNDRDQYTLQYMNLYCQIAGTTPSITFDSWFSPSITGGQ